MLYHVLQLTVDEGTCKEDIEGNLNCQANCHQQVMRTCSLTD